MVVTTIDAGQIPDLSNTGDKFSIELRNAFENAANQFRKKTSDLEEVANAVAVAVPVQPPFILQDRRVGSPANGLQVVGWDAIPASPNMLGLHPSLQVGEGSSAGRHTQQMPRIEGSGGTEIPKVDNGPALNAIATALQFFSARPVQQAEATQPVQTKPTEQRDDVAVVSAPDLVAFVAPQTVQTQVAVSNNSAHTFVEVASITQPMGTTQGSVKDTRVVASVTPGAQISQVLPAQTKTQQVFVTRVGPAPITQPKQSIDQAVSVSAQPVSSIPTSAMQVAQSVPLNSVQTPTLPTSNGPVERAPLTQPATTPQPALVKQSLQQDAQVFVAPDRKPGLAPQAVPVQAAIPVTLGTSAATLVDAQISTLAPATPVASVVPHASVAPKQQQAFPALTTVPTASGAPVEFASVAKLGKEAHAIQIQAPVASASHTSVIQPQQAVPMPAMVPVPLGAPVKFAPVMQAVQSTSAEQVSIQVPAAPVGKSALHIPQAASVHPVQVPTVVEPVKINPSVQQKNGTTSAKHELSELTSSQAATVAGQPATIQHVYVSASAATDKKSPASTEKAVKQQAEIVALRESDMRPGETKVSFNWGGDQSVTISRTSATRYKLSASDGEVEQVLTRRLAKYDGSLPLGISSISIEGSTDKESGQRHRTNYNHVDNAEE